MSLTGGREELSAGELLVAEFLCTKEGKESVEGRKFLNSSSTPFY